MICSHDNPGKRIRTAKLKLGEGFWAVVALSDSSEGSLTVDDWRQCLCEPELLVENFEMLLKKDGPCGVAVKTVTIKGKQQEVVVKYQGFDKSFGVFFRSIGRVKSLRNFKTAVRLTEHNIPVAYPLAAVYQKKGPLTKQSIYISEYLGNSDNLHNFVRGRFVSGEANLWRLKKQFSAQLAGILASLHNAGFWHRDGKASNFVVFKDSGDQYELKLVDMDGIKKYFLRRSQSRWHCLWRLGACFIGIAGINKTDYFRTFTIYCSLTGIKYLPGKQIFRKLVSRAMAKWLLLSQQRRV